MFFLFLLLPLFVIISSHFTTFGTSDIDTFFFASCSSKALNALNLEVHLLKAVSLKCVNIKRGPVNPYLCILRSFVFKCICSDGHVKEWHFQIHMVSFQHGKIYKITPMLLALRVLSEAHATHYLKECQGIELHKVQLLIPTTRILNVYCRL